MDIKVTFDAFKVPSGTGPEDIRIIIPKGEYMLAAEDNSCYYIQPLVSLNAHVAQEQP